MCSTFNLPMILKQVNDDTFLEFWNDYLRPFSSDGFDTERIYDIEDRMDISEYVKVIAGNLSRVPFSMTMSDRFWQII